MTTMLLNVTTLKQTLLLSRELSSSRYHSRHSGHVPIRQYTQYTSGIPGSGAGKGGGAGGSIRESGGGLGRYGAAQEEGYFYHKQREQLEKIKKQMKKEAVDVTQKPPAK